MLLPTLDILYCCEETEAHMHKDTNIVSFIDKGAE